LAGLSMGNEEKGKREADPQILTDYTDSKAKGG
jgi:hypothetical protein